jgi:hypothetical protein
MVYKWDSFLKPIAEGDTVIQILDNNGLVKYSIDPFSIINTFINNNIVKINIKSDVILINFSTNNEAKLALPLLQQQIDLLKNKVPNFIDKKIENYVLEQLNSQTQSSTFNPVIINSNLIPATGSTYDLGATAGYNWRDLYLSGDTIYLGDSTIKSESNNIIIDNLILGGPTSQGGILLTTDGDSFLVNGNPIDSQSVLPYLKLTNQIFNPYIGDEISFRKLDYGNEIDEISEGLHITRGDRGWLYNPLVDEEYDDETPTGSLWNSDGWGTLIDVKSRNYVSFRESLDYNIGDNILGIELIMYDTINDEYWTFKFTNWTKNQNGGGFSYIRRQINKDIYFVKSDYGNEIDEISEGLHITRGDRGWLYNPLVDEEHDDETPTGSLWNNGGWDNLTDIEQRNYSTIESIWDGNFRDITGSEMIMLDTTTNIYWLIKFLSWTDGNNGGGFSYIRYKVDLNILNDGINFADGTSLKTANGLGKVKFTSVGGRRIEEIYGYSEVEFIEIQTIQSASGIAINNPSFQTWDVYLDRSSNPDIESIMEFANTLNVDYSWRLTLDGEVVNSSGLYPYYVGNGQYIIIFLGYDDNNDYLVLQYSAGSTLFLELIIGGQPVRWFRAEGNNLRGAIIDYHAYVINLGTIIGTIHISRDSGRYTIAHTESKSGSSNIDQADLWYRNEDSSEREIWFRRLDGQNDTLKVQWSAKLFYGNEYWD